MDRIKVQRVRRIRKGGAYISFQSKRERYQGQRYFTLNKSGKNAPMRLRPDFRAAVSLKNGLHRKSGEQVAEPISPQQYGKWQRFMVGHVDLELAELIRNMLSDFFFVTVGFVYSRWRSTVTDGVCTQIHLTRDFFMHLANVNTH